VTRWVAPKEEDIVRFLAISLTAFFVIAGEALGALPRNSVGSAQVKPNSLKGVDINESKLGPVPQANSLQGKVASDFQLRVTGACDPGEAIFAINADGTVQCLPVGASGLADVAFSGDYADLIGTPSLAAVATSGDYADLSGTPSLAAIATTGAWDDLIGIPADIADGDDGASYTAGAGLTLTGNEFSITGGGINGSMLAPGAVTGGIGGTVADNSINSDDVGPNAVGASELADDAVDFAAMLDDAVGFAEMRDDAIGFAEMRDNAVGNDEMRDDAIGASELANSAVVGGLGGDLQDNTLTTDDIGPSAIQSSELANGAVVGGIGGDVLDNSITADDLAQDTWNLTGNSGINPGNQFLGTSDAQPLQLRTNNVNRLVISATGAVDVSGSLSIGGNLTIGGGTAITRHRSGLVTVPGPTTNIAGGSCSDFSATLTGAALGDTVSVGAPNISGQGTLMVTGFVSAADTVTLRACNVAALGSVNAAGTYRLDVWGH
jgi:hypothetical protein